MDKPYSRERILETLGSKGVLKQDVFDICKKQFAILKETLQKFSEDLRPVVRKLDSRLEIEFRDRGPFHCELLIAGDILVFYMHSNIFKFAPENELWKTGYLQENPKRGYCSTILVYNFLADSFRLGRDQDLGYLLGRIFINSEEHYYVQSHNQVGLYFNDFIHAKLGKAEWKNVIIALIQFAMDFDLYSPPFQTIQQVTVAEMTELSSNLSLKTGKRLGFQFVNTDSEIRG